MNTPPPGIHIPLTVAFEGKPVLLETKDHLRTLRAFLDTWIAIYDKAEKLPPLPQLPQHTTDGETPHADAAEPLQAPVEAVDAHAEADARQEPKTPDTAEGEGEEKQASEEPQASSESNASSAAAPPAVLLQTIDYIVAALQQQGGSLSIDMLYSHMRELGWSTLSSDLPKARRTIENTARKYPQIVSVHKGTVQLVESAASQSPQDSATD